MDLEMRNILHAYKLPDTEMKSELEEASRLLSEDTRPSDTESSVQLEHSVQLSSSLQPECSKDPECSIQSESSIQPESLVPLESSIEPESSHEFINQPESQVQKQQEETKTAKPSNKRKKTPEKLIIKKPRENAPYEMESDSDGDENYISNIPQDVEEGGVTTEIEQDDKIMSQSVYHIGDDLKTVAKQQDDDKTNGKKLYDKSPGNDAEFIDDTSVTTELSCQSIMVPDDDARDSDPLKTCGLKIEFLESLGITPPIDKWVHVTNFRCDKFELRDVMELAGQVLSCSVVNVNKRFAKVQYSHPLEAVQAVSMLNGQMYFGLKLKVYIERNSKNDIILPKGLVNIGLGLGLQGRPVRDIVRQYRKFARRQNSTINPILFRKINYGYRNYNDDEEKTNDSQMDVEEFVASTKTSTFADGRSFKIKHVEDLDSNDDGKEKSKRNSSPESQSEKSVDSPVSNNGLKEDKSSDAKVTATSSTTPQAEVPTNFALPLSLSRGHTSMSYPRSILPQNRPFRPQMSPAVPYIPCPPVPPIPDPNVPYTGPFKPGPFCNAVPNHIPNPVVNQPQQGSPAIALNYMQISNQGPSGPGPVHRPSVPMPNSAPIQRPSTFPGSGPVSGPGPAPGPVHRPGPTPEQVMSLVQGVFSGPGTVLGQVGPIASHGVRGPQPGPSMRPGSVNRPAVSGPIGPMPKKTTSTVQFTNLPPSTTFPFLCEKMSQCGQVMSLQFTTPGCALVTFGHPAQAERCYHTYNGMNVEGCRISVTLV